jgi:hypothetical protein
MAALDFPDTPITGDQYGVSGPVWRWDGARWALTAGAAGARGAVAYAQITASQGSIVGTAVDVTGLSVSWTASSSRTYRTTVHLVASSTVQNDDFNAFITDAAGTQKQFHLNPYLDPSTSSGMEFSVVETGLSGTITRKVRAVRGAGTGTITLYAAATAPSFILVEDITYA